MNCQDAHPGVACARTEAAAKALADGKPELAAVASGGYCAPDRCYCGGCPGYLPIGVRPTNTPDPYTAYDRAAVLSSTGRRTNVAQYRAAQQERARR